MNQHAIPANGIGLSVVLVIAFAWWCWFSSGPLFGRWISLVVLIVMFSGTAIGNACGALLEPVAPALLTILTILFGLRIMFRGAGWHARRRYHGYRKPWRYER
jgi:hypothetical protein